MKKIALIACAVMVSAMMLVVTGCSSTSSSTPASTPASDSTPVSTPESTPDDSVVDDSVADDSVADDSVADDSMGDDGQADAGVLGEGTVVATAEYTITVPEGFHVISEDPLMAIAEDESAVFGLTIGETTGELEGMTQEDFEALQATELAETDGVEMMTIVSFEHIEVDGYPAIYLKTILTTGDAEAEATKLAVDNGSKTYSFTFNDMTGSWADVFAATIDSISFA